MKRYFTRLREAAEERPLEALAIGAIAVTATAKIINANTERRNSTTWQKEVERRRMMSR